MELTATLKGALQYILDAAIDDLLSRADYGRTAAEIDVIVVERGPEDRYYRPGTQRHQSESLTLRKVIVVIAGLRIRYTCGGGLTGSYMLYGVTSAQLRYTGMSR